MEFKFVEALTNKKLVRHYDSLNKKASKLCDWFVANGFGGVRPSEMRIRRSEHPKFGEYLDILAEMRDLKDEAKRRYGPDFVYVGQLGHVL